MLGGGPSSSDSVDVDVVSGSLLCKCVTAAKILTFVPNGPGSCLVTGGSVGTTELMLLFTG